MPTQSSPTINGNGDHPSPMDFLDSLDPIRGMFVANALMSRKEWIEKYFDPDKRRNIAKECGWPDSVTTYDYQRQYDRNAIANRVVQVFARESWQVQPWVYENDDPTVTTTFERAWNSLARQFRKSFRRQHDKNASIWEYLIRADILSGIGQYGVILLGLDDGEDMASPAYPLEFPDSGVDAGSLVISIPGTDPGPRAVPLIPAPEELKKWRLIYLRVLPESLVDIERYEENENNPRYGLPIIYKLSLSDPSKMTWTATVNITPKRVHWTRLVHVADNLESSEFLGVPRQQAVFNNILDIRKVTGGSAEMYWQAAFLGLSFETHPALGGDVTIDAAQMKGMIENYFNGLQRYLNPRGMSVKSLAPQVSDPSPQIERQIEQICIKLGIPKRIFMGSERGELASSQDDAAWNDRLRERQRNYITPRIIEPFIDQLIYCGVLPMPEGFSGEKEPMMRNDASNAPGDVIDDGESGYVVWWPDLTSQTESEKAEVMFKRSQALAQYVTSKAYVMMSPIDYFVRVWGMDEMEAHAVWEAREADPSFKEAFEALQPPQQPGNDASKPGDDNGGAAATADKNGG